MDDLRFCAVNILEENEYLMLLNIRLFQYPVSEYIEGKYYNLSRGILNN